MYYISKRNFLFSAQFKFWQYHSGYVEIRNSDGNSTITLAGTKRITKIFVFRSMVILKWQVQFYKLIVTGCTFIQNICAGKYWHPQDINIIIFTSSIYCYSYTRSWYKLTKSEKNFNLISFWLFSITLNKNLLKILISLFLSSSILLFGYFREYKTAGILIVNHYDDYRLLQFIQTFIVVKIVEVN